MQSVRLPKSLRLICVSLTCTLCALMLACGTNDVPAPPTISVASTIHPLVAQVSVTSQCSGQAMVEFGTDTSYGRTTSWFPLAGRFQTTDIQVAGMKASTTYHMRSTTTCAGNTFSSADQTFTTGALPASTTFPTITVSRPNPGLTPAENPGIELVNVFAPNNNTMQALFTDRDGNPIWYYDVGAAQGNSPYTFKVLPNGHMIVSITRAITAGTIMREIDLAGNTIREMDTGQLSQSMQSLGYNFAPTGYHHDVLPLENGHLILLTNFTKNFTDLPGYPGTTAVLGDGIVDLDENWTPVW